MFKRNLFSTEPRAFIAREIKEGFKCYKIPQSWQIGLAADEVNGSFMEHLRDRLVLSLLLAEYFWV